MKNAKPCKTYHHGVNAIDCVDAALVLASGGIGGADLLCAIMPIVLNIECASCVCGLLGVVGKFISHRLAIKVKKWMKSELWPISN